MTLLEAPAGEMGEALISYLAKYHKSATRERLEEIVGKLPLVLGQNVPEHIAQRITTDLEALGAKLHYTPAFIREKEAEASRPEPAVPLKSLREALLTDGFTHGRIRFPISPLYRAGLLLVAIVMIILPLVYVGIIAAAGYLLLWHTISNAHIFADNGDIRLDVVLYVTPIVVGTILIFFLVKPLFARRAGSHLFYEVIPSEEPLLHAFIKKVCVSVGAPVPRSVRIDTQVNAFASFQRGMLSFSSDDLALTIGLPLAAGLNVNEFAGVLAHEFGHFAQSSGMRLTYIIRTINYWFTRVVYEEDEWDVRLRTWSRHPDFRIAVILKVTRLFIWVGKMILLLLLKISHPISCFMLRQMEYDADRYEAAMVGAGTFESTCDKFALLSAAHSWAFEDLDRASEEGRLADNLPELIMANLHQMKVEDRREIIGSSKRGKTGFFDTHPADRDRVASAREVSGDPVFSWPAGCHVEMPGGSGTSADGTRTGSGSPPPATVLFRDFPDLSRHITMCYYQEIFGRTPEQKNLVGVGAMVQSNDEEKEYSSTLDRYFLGRFSTLIPLGIGAERLLPPADPGEAVRKIGVLRNELLEQDPKHEELLRQIFRLWERITDATKARSLIVAGFTINPKEFNVPGVEVADVLKAERRYSEREKQILDNIGEITRLYRERLTLGLQLLQTPSAAGQIANGNEFLREIDTYREAMDVLETQFPILRKLSYDFQALVTLTHKIAGNKKKEALWNSIELLMGTIGRDLGHLCDGLGQAPYPFDHARQEMTLGLFIVDPNYGVCGLGDLLGIAETAIDRMTRLYARLAARLAHAVEEMEKLHGMPPLNI